MTKPSSISCASTRSARWRWTRCRRPTPATRARRWRWPRSPTRCGSNVLRFDPDDPIWPNRDRFVLSAGHASMLLYSLLHLTQTSRRSTPKYERLGEPSVPLDDIKKFRQLDSKCPGHPEYRWTSRRRDHDRPARPGLRDQRRHGDRRRWLGRALQPARLRRCSTTTSTRSAATAA